MKSAQHVYGKIEQYQDFGFRRIRNGCRLAWIDRAEIMDDSGVNHLCWVSIMLLN
ncbi:hypothetical protein D1AOALGA4SA_10132 [Olavius algarvensis Delta 1 endosymbiont]|nr:hypothetical protein D1AOALGA4SA_10132 [Olavius algarvensis Delta 1 endosymbiont]